MKSTLVAGSGINLRNNYGVPPAVNHVHYALDIFAPEGTPQCAPDDGVVTARAESDSDNGGWWYRFEGQDGERYYCAHNTKRVAAAVGARVLAGTVLGRVGRSGNARNTEAHLHVEGTAPDARAVRRRVKLWVPQCRLAGVDPAVRRHDGITIPLPVVASPSMTVIKLAPFVDPDAPLPGTFRPRPDPEGTPDREAAPPPAPGTFPVVAGVVGALVLAVIVYFMVSR